MFKRDTVPARSEQVGTIIGKDTQIKGTISGVSGMRLDGNVEGNVETQGDVIIGEGSTIIADIKGRNVVIAGLVKGNVVAVEKIEVMPSGKIEGEIASATLIINEGGQFNGKSDMTVRSTKTE
jgi:cytoskeletal protein CcmA (bactofilin family)